MPARPQTYLFSATLPAPIASLAKRFLKDPFRIQLGESGGATQHADITHTPCLVADHLQTKALVNFLLLDEPSSALIFTKMKQQTETVAEALRDAGLAADYLHGDLNQGARNRIMSSFKEGKLRYLVATDVAARGIDVENMPLVVHMGIPTQFENYIHRSGRTGRAGAKGTSMALVSFKESRILLAWGRRGGLQAGLARRPHPGGDPRSPGQAPGWHPGRRQRRPPGPGHPDAEGRRPRAPRGGPAGPGPGREVRRFRPAERAGEEAKPRFDSPRERKGAVPSPAFLRGTQRARGEAPRPDSAFSRDPPRRQLQAPPRVR